MAAATADVILPDCRTVDTDLEAANSRWQLHRDRGLVGARRDDAPAAPLVVAEIDGAVAGDTELGAAHHDLEHLDSRCVGQINAVRDKIAEVQGANDWVKDSFAARSAENEVRLPGLTVQQLVSTRDVTGEVNQGVEAGASPEEMSETREANRRRLVRDAQRAAPELRSEVVELFQGASFQLYSYRIASIGSSLAACTAG